MKRIATIIILIVAMLTIYSIAFAEETVEQELDREAQATHQELQAEPATTAQGPGSSYFDGAASGKNDAEGDLLYGCGGFACGIFGVLAALLITPEVDPVMLGSLNRTYGNDYAQGYQYGYVRQAKKKNLTYSLVGLALGVATSVMYSLTIVVDEKAPSVKVGIAIPFGNSHPSFSPGR